MQCPMCLETALEARFDAGIEIDVCPKCHGVWLDRGELEKLANAPQVDSPRHDSHDRDKPAKSASKKKSKKKRKKSLGARLGDVLDEVLDFD